MTVVPLHAASVPPPVLDAAEAHRFLTALYPAGPWLISLIPVEGGEPEVVHLDPRGSADEGLGSLTRALERNRRGTHNAYFPVNPSARVTAKKATKDDIDLAGYLHVDIDYRVGEDLAAEAERIRSLLSEGLPIGLREPTAVVFSGGGYWAFWRLSKPAPLDGVSGEATKAVEDRNRQLALLLGGDSCHNVDRIARLPGSVNWPDAKKRKKGRVPGRAQVVELHGDRAYGLADFTPMRAAGPPAGVARPPVNIEGEPARLQSVDELDEWRVPDRVKVIIVQGHDPDNPKTGDNSRSAWVFDVCCHLARCSVPDEVIFSILTDPGFGISESILEKGSTARRHAERQINRAHEHAVNPALVFMNEAHAVLSAEGGKCRVASWVVVDDDRRTRRAVVLQTFEDVRNRYMNQLVEVGQDDKGRPITKPMGDWWLRHPARRQFESLTFQPGQDLVVGNRLNLWDGWGVEPRAGDWALMHQHITDGLAAGDEASATYILRWAAWAVQNPGRPAEVALVLKSGKGTGKGMFARLLGDLFGNAYVHVSDMKHVGGAFNAHLRNAAYLFADEAYAAGDHAAEGTLKRLITEPTLLIEGKGRDAVMARNCLHVLMATNNAWAVPASTDERRFAVFQVSEARRGDRAWFGSLLREIEAGGAAAMLHDLLAMDLAGWHPRDDVPDTLALREQKRFSLSPFDEWLLHLAEVGELPGDEKGSGWARSAALYEQARAQVPALRFESDTKLGLVLRTAGCTNQHRRGSRGWQFPPLADLRAVWDAKLGSQDWSSGLNTTWEGNDATPF